MELCTAPPPGSTVICAGELGPVIPRTFAPAPGWPPGGHRITAPREDARGPAKTWVYRGLRAAGGPAITRGAPSRTSAACQDFLHQAERANPEGAIYVITGNLSSHDSTSTRAWLEDHPRIRHAFIPKGRLPAEPAQGLAADRPPPGAGRAGLRRPCRDRLRHPGWPPPSSTPAPGRGSGDGPSPNTVPTADALYTPFEERSTRTALK